MADLDLTVGVDTAAAEEGLRRLNGQFDRDMRSIERRKAVAKIGADTTKLDREVAKAKRKLLELEKQEADPNVELDTKQFNAEVAAVKARLKELSVRKAEIRVDTKKLKDANALMDISAQRQERMAKQTEKLDRAKEKMARTTALETDNFYKQRVEIEKLRERYAKLAGDERRLRDKTGRPAGILRSAKENRELERTRREMDLVRHRVVALNGSITDIDPDLDVHDSRLARWGQSLLRVRIHMGFFSASIKQLSIGLVFLGPQLTALLGSATSLVGVVGTGLVGALAAATAGLAGFATSALGAGLIIKPIIGELEAATKASEAYNAAVLKYGRGTDQARAAHEKLEQTLKGISPEARKSIKLWGGVRAEWEKLTESAREPLFDAAGESIETIRALLPVFAAESTKTTEVLTDGWGEWMQMLRSQGARAGLQEIMSNFRLGLPPLLDGFTSLGTIIGRVAESASGFLPGLNRGFAEWADNLERSIGTGNALDEKIGRLIKHMREFGHFAQATGRLAVALFGGAADSGAGLLRTLTELFNNWADWMQTVEGQKSMRHFFAEAANEARGLFAGLGRLIGLIFQLGRATAPISDAFFDLFKLLGGFVDAVTDISVLNTALGITARLLVGIWAVNKAQAFAGAVAAAANSLRLLSVQAPAAAAGMSILTGAPAAGAGARGLATGAGAGVVGAEIGQGVGRSGGKAASGSLAAGLLAGLRRIRWARVGLIGIGVGLADAAIGEFQQRSAERSDDLFTFLKARAGRDRGWFEKTLAPLGSLFGDVDVGEEGLVRSAKKAGNAAGQTLLEVFTPYKPRAFNLAKDVFFGKPEDTAAKNVLAQIEEIRRGRAKISAETERSLRNQIEEAEWTEKKKDAARKILSLTRLGRKLDIKVTGGMNPQQLNKMLDGFRKLRSGAITNLGDIGKISRETAQLIRTTLPRGSDEMRRKLGENFRLAADNIKDAVDKGLVDHPKKALKRAQQLMRNAKLIEGRDPLGIAKGFRDAWREAGKITPKELRRQIQEVQKMPKPMQREAARSMMAYARGLRQGGAISKEEMEAFKSTMITELGNIGAGFSGLSGTVYEALGNIGKNLHEALSDLGVGKPPEFNLNRLPRLPSLKQQQRQERKQGGPVERQHGGFTVPGYGSGDKVYRELPPGSFVMNREAAKAGGMREGGIPTILEPKERVFMPKEVKRHGAQNLQAWNDAVPRQRGGGIGPEPIIDGPPGGVRDVGRGAIAKAYAAAKRKYEKATAAAPGGPLGGGSAAWRRIDAIAAALGLVPGTLTGRLGEAGSWHGIAGPGGRARATDYSGPAGGMLRFATRLANTIGGSLKELIYSPLGFSIDNGSRTAPFAVSSHYDHVHVAMQLGGLIQQLAEGGIVAERFAQSTAAHKAPYNAAMGLFEAGVVETGDPTLSTNPTGGHSTSRGSLQLLAETARAFNVNPMNIRAVADLFHTKGFWGKGGAIQLARSGMPPGDIAQAVQGSAYPERYAQQAGVARDLILGSGLRYNGQQFKGYGQGAGSAREAVPKTVTAKYPVTGRGGGTGLRKTQVEVETPKFGPLPKGEANIKRELAHVERVLLPKYRAAWRQNKGKKVRAKLKVAIKAIEKRIRELRAALRKERTSKAKRRTKKKLTKQLESITGRERGIEAARREYEKRDQYAQQVVELEPEQNGELTHDWIDRVFEPYIDNQEAPAYGAVLQAENTWRNTILGAQGRATDLTRAWETIIGYPKNRKPFLDNPDLHYPPQRGDMATGLAKNIYGLYDRMQVLRKQIKHRARKPKKTKADRDVLGAMRKEMRERREQMNFAKFRRGATTETLGEGRDSFNWFRGTGSFEDAMIDVQGQHWPDQHTPLASLPPHPVPGHFGGAIWSTQTAIRELDLKVKQAKESIADDTSAADKAAELKAFEEAIRSLLSGRPFLSLNHQPLVGAFASGGMLPRSGYALVGERGPELAYLPGGTQITNNERTKEVLESGSSVVNVTNNFAAPPPDPHTFAKQQQFELGALA